MSSTFYNMDLTWVILPQWTWVMSGDICGCHDWGAPGVKGVGAKEVAPHPTAPKTAPPHTENDLVPKVSRVKRPSHNSSPFCRQED